MPLMNRTLSIRNNKPSGSNKSQSKLFGRLNSRNDKPDATRHLNSLVKSQGKLCDYYESIGDERDKLAKTLSTWGGDTGDDAVSDLSDKVGVLLVEIGELERVYAEHLAAVRGRLKIIRNTEKSIAPARAERIKITNDIQKLKMKNPESEELETLEQSLVRSEAQNLVADAQIGNATRSKLKEAYSAEFSAIIERAEKQIILAKHGRRLLQLLDENPIAPGETRPAYEYGLHARQIINDAEDDMREWQPSFEEDYQEGLEENESFNESEADGVAAADLSTNGRSRKRVAVVA